MKKSVDTFISNLRKHLYSKYGSLAKAASALGLSRVTLYMVCSQTSPLTSKYVKTLMSKGVKVRGIKGISEQLDRRKNLKSENSIRINTKEKELISHLKQIKRVNFTEYERLINLFIKTAKDRNEKTS